MRFKLFNSIVLSLLVLTIGCGIKTGEKKPVQQQAKVEGTSCLKKSLDDFKTYIDGTATDEQVGRAADCFQKIILTFIDNVRGKDKYSYTAAEIADFVLTKVMNSQTHVSPEFLSEVMKFKVALLGGNNQVITRAELKALSSVVGRLKSELIRLNPHIKVLLSKWDFAADEKSVRDEKFKAAREAFKTAGDKLADLFAESGEAYELADFAGFVTELVKTFDISPSVAETIKTSAPLLIKFKINIIGGTSALVGDQWNSFISGLTEVFAQQLRIHYFIKPLTADQSDEKLDAYQNVAADVLNLLAELLERRGALNVKNAQINEVLAEAKKVFPAVDISPDLIEQVGKIKLILIGKTNNSYSALSAEDCRKLVQVLPSVFQVVKTAMANLKYYKFDAEGFRKGAIKYEDFLKAEKILTATITKFSEHIQYSYDLQDLKKLVISIKPLLGDGVHFPDNLDQLFGLVYSAKVALTGEAGPQLTVPNIQLILKTGVKVYGHAVEISNFVFPFSIGEKEFTDFIEPWYLKLSATLAEHIAAKSTHVTTTAELTNLVLAAQNAKLLKTEIRKESLDQLLNALWSNVLNTPESRLHDNLIQPGFNGIVLQNLSEELKYWLINQKVAFKIFATRPEYNKDEIVGALRQSLNAVDKTPLAPAVAELVRVVQAPGLMNYNDKFYLKILTPDSGMYHQRDIITTNLSRALARVFVRSFGKDLERINNYTGINREEINSGFEMIKNTFIDLDFIAADNVTFANKRFLDMQLFLSVSNGDEFASFEDFNHLVLHIMSGTARAKNLAPMLLKECSLPTVVVLRSQSELDESCVLGVYLRENAAFEDLPWFLKLKTDTTHTPEQTKSLYLSLLKAAGFVRDCQQPPTDPAETPKLPICKHLGAGININPPDLEDVNMFPHIVQYVEMLYARFDKNLDGELDKSEALTAFPVFEATLDGLRAKFPLLKLKKENLPGLFIYIIKNRKIGNLIELKKFVNDYDCSDPTKPCQVGWDVHADRYAIGEVFNFIAEAIK